MSLQKEYTSYKLLIIKAFGMYYYGKPFIKNRFWMENTADSFYGGSCRSNAVRNEMYYPSASFFIAAT